MKKEQSLSDAISPESYDLTFEPDLEKFTFQGKAHILINLKKPTSSITLNSSELVISSTKVTYNNLVIPSNIAHNENRETITLKLPKKISGTATLEFEFNGILNDKLYGFYRSKYTQNNKTKYLATSQFEAPYARKAFPCFDQPDKKATFSLTLKIPKNLKAISNMPVTSTQIEDNKKSVKFQITPKMSTYLLYLGVGDFESIESKLGKTKISIITLPGKSNQGKFALELTKKFLKYFQDYSQVPYPLPKIDMIAIPDFAAGAMENWGAITFREVLLLFDPKKTSTIVKKRIAEVIAHELWHQWSGNLVTMKWWNDLWLNESFATYMAYKAVHDSFPEWKMWQDFVGGETAWAFREDSLKNTHPIAVPVNSPNDIEEIFDGISYGKGGSVLRMIESYLGSKAFQKGISSYLKKHKYQNATAPELWNELAKVSKSPIKQVMTSWIQQPGFPLVTATRKDNTLTLEQKKFNSTKVNKTVWKIPLTIKTPKKTIKTLLTKKTQTLKLPANTKWFKINTNQEGFYRVKYDTKSLQALTNSLSSNQLSEFDRAGLQDDLFSLAQIQEQPLSTYFDLIKTYKNENSHFVLSSIYSNIYYTYLLFSRKDYWKTIWPKFKDHLKAPFENALKKLSWQPQLHENQNDTLLRPLSISYLAFSGHPETLKIGQQKFAQYLKNKNLHPDLKAPVLALAARKGDNKKFNSLIKLYKHTDSAEEKLKILSALYKFENPKLLTKALDFSLSSNVRIQDLRTVFSITSGNPNARSIYFPWTISNWKKLQKFQKTHFVFMGLLDSLITTYTGKQKEKELKEFLKTKKVAYEKTKTNAFEKMQMNTSLLEKNSPVLKEYFS
jgi:tricorn protease interacting factor F2/3